MKLTTLRFPLLWLLLFWGLIENGFLHAQQIGLGFLFRPHVRLGMDYLPSKQINDSLRFQMNRYSLNAVVPLSGKIEASLQDLSLKASYHFLTFNTGFRTPNVEYASPHSRLYNASIGISGIRGALLKGAYFYTLNLGFVQEGRSLDQMHPFGIAAFAKLQIKGIYKHNIYGVALLYQYKRFLPVPLLGLNRKIAKNLTTQILLPAQATLSYKINRKLKIDWTTSLLSFRGGIIPNLSWIGNQNTNPTFQNPNLNYTHLRSGLMARYQIGSRWQLEAEGGYALFRNLYLQDQNEQYFKHTVPATFYGGIALRMDLGKGVVSSKLFGNDF